MADDDVDVKFGASIDGALSGMSQIADALEDLGGPIGSLIAHFKELGETIIEALAIEQVIAFVDEISEAAAQVEHLAVSLGMTATEMSEFAAVADLMDVGTQQAGMSLLRIERGAAQAANGTGAAAKAFADLHVSVTDADGNMKSMAQLLPQIADGFAQNKDHMQAVNDLIAIGGRGMANMAVIFAQGSKGLEEYNAQVEATGVVLNQNMAEGFDKTAIQSKLLDDAWKGMKITLAEAFKPAVDAIIGGLIEFVEAMNRAFQSGGVLHGVLILLVAVFDVLATAIDFGTTIFSEFVDVFNVGIHIISDLLTTVGKVMEDVFSGHWDKAAQDTREGLQRVSEEWTTFTQKISKETADFNARETAMYANLGSTGDRTKDKPTGSGGKPPPDPRLQEAELADAEKLSLAKIAQEVEYNKNKFALGQETAQQLLGVEVSAENQKYEVEKEFLTKKAALAGTDKVKAEQDKAALQQLEVTHQTALNKLQAEGAEKAQQLAAQQTAEFIKEADNRLKTGMAAIEEDYKLGQITIQKKIADEKTLTKSILDEEIERASAQRDKSGVAGTEKYEAENNKVIALREQRDAKLAQLDAELKEKEQQQAIQSVSDLNKNDEDELKSALQKYEEEYKQHQITIEQKVALEKALTEKIKDEEITRLTNLRDSLTKGTDEWRDANNKIIALTTQRNQQLDAMNAQLDQHWTQVSDKYASIFGGALSTMLTSTQTWQQQVINILNRLIDNFIQTVIEPMISNWIKKEFLQTAATVAGNQERVAAAAAGAAEGSTAERAGSLATIMQNAYKAASATWASVSQIPIVGPFLAPAAAAATFVAVAAFGSALPSAAGGMVVQEDTLAQVHKNEMVLPAHLSTGISDIVNSGKRGGGGAGDLIYSPTINHNEPASLAQMLNDESHSMRAWLSQQTRDGHIPFGA